MVLSGFAPASSSHSSSLTVGAASEARKSVRRSVRTFHVVMGAQMVVGDLERCSLGADGPRPALTEVSPVQGTGKAGPLLALSCCWHRATYPLRLSWCCRQSRHVANSHVDAAKTPYLRP